MNLHKIIRVLHRYIFLREDINRSVTEVESQDVIFLEEDFPGRGEIDRDTHFYEIEYPEVSEGVRIIDSTLTGPDNIVSLTPLEVSGSDNLLDRIPMEQDHEQSQPRHSNHEIIPLHMIYYMPNHSLYYHPVKDVIELRQDTKFLM